MTGLVAVLMAVGAAGCAGDDAGGLSELAQQGKTTAADKGCASCHGSDGQGGIGPAWVGLAGSEVEIRVPEDEGGGTRIVVADDDYLRRSILDPDAEEAVGFTVKMPANTLSEAEADQIVAYIKELTGEEG